MIGKRLEAFVALAFVASGLVALCGGCGSGGTSMNTPVTAAQVSAVTLTITDAPPAGVTVLSFEVTVNGAVLSPGNVQLIASPQKIEVKQLEAESAFLSTMNVPAGTYQSIAINVTNPELTILNQTGAAIGSCANNAVCHLEPSAAGNITFSGASFPVVLQGGTPEGFQVDVNVANLISNTLTLDFNATGAVSVAQLPLPGQPNDHFDDVDDLLGTVQNLSASSTQFTLRTRAGDFLIQANSSTQFELEDCAADNFSCLQNGQVVEVDASLMSGGAFVAKKIEIEDDQAQDELEGVIFKIDDATHFEVVVLGELRAMNSVDLGNTVTVSLTNPQFQVQADGLSVPSSLQGSFEGATDTSQLIPGQDVQIKASSGVNAGSPITMTASRVRLRMSQFTANVSGAPSPPNFNLTNLPGLLTGAGITSVQVQTSSKTNFQGVAGVNALVDQDRVSLRGLLFKNGASAAQLIADKVRKR
jgi:hypothetical protein